MRLTDRGWLKTHRNEYEPTPFVVIHCTVGSRLNLTVGLTPGVSAFICGTVKTVPYFFVLSQALVAAKSVLRLSF